MNKSGNIKFFFAVSGVNLRNRTKLKSFILRLFKIELKSLDELNYIFCTDKYLLKINLDFLGHDYYTDIITFDLSDGPAIRGEVYISIDRVRNNARRLGVSFKSELHRVIFHGALHLCGYDDKTKKDKEEMRKKENYYIDQYFKHRSTGKNLY